MSLGKDYIFKSQTKKQLLILFASGNLLTIVGIFMITVLLPFWTSLLVRTYAWLVLLQKKGII